MKKMLLFYLWLIMFSLNNWKIYLISMCILGIMICDSNFSHKFLFVVYYILMLSIISIDVNWVRQNSLTRFKLIKLYKKHAFKI